MACGSIGLPNPPFCDVLVATLEQGLGVLRVLGEDYPDQIGVIVRRMPRRDGGIWCADGTTAMQVVAEWRTLAFVGTASRLLAVAVPHEKHPH